MAVSELNAYISRQLKYDPILSQVLVVGEISNFKRHSSGHLYFTLKDMDSKIQCVMFKSEASTLKYQPVDGEKTEIRGRVSVYEREGRYQIYVSNMSPVGQGELFKAFVEMKDQLGKNGFFDKCRPLPRYPKRIGVITSPTSAAVRDFITVFKRRNQSTELIIYPVRVQGEKSCFEVSNAIEYFNEHPVDLIVLTRGGGSLEELWSFNEMPVIESIFASKVPVVSGVGHETDFTLSDFAADVRAATPSEAAEIVSQDTVHLEANLNVMFNRMKQAMINRTHIMALHLERNNKNKLCQLMQHHVSLVTNDLEVKKDQMTRHMKLHVENKANTLEKLGVSLDGVSPLNTLKRGYAVALKNNQSIASIDQVDMGDNIDIILKNGIIKTEVISKERKTLDEQKR